MKQLNYCIYILFVLLREHFVKANWECKDGSIFVPFESVSFPGRTFSPPVGCIYKREGFKMTQGEYYFELKVGNTGGSVKVGVATETASREFLYDQHLSNGCETPLKRYFGDIVNPELLKQEAVDTIGVIVIINQQGMWLYLLHDGVPLGLAFKITNPPTPLFPAIRVSAQATVEITKKSFKQKTMENQLQRSKNIPNNFYRLKAVTRKGENMDQRCKNQQIRLRPYLTQRIKNDLTGDNVHVSFSFGREDDNIEGILHKQQNKWTFVELKNDCLESVKDVLNNIASLEINDGIITAKSSDGSFEAEWSEFPPVNCY